MRETGAGGGGEVGSVGNIVEWRIKGRARQEQTGVRWGEDLRASPLGVCKCPRSTTPVTEEQV